MAGKVVNHKEMLKNENELYLNRNYIYTANSLEKNVNVPVPNIDEQNLEWK